MHQIGYALIDATGKEVAAWGHTPGLVPGVPDVITLPNGDRVHCPELDSDYSGCRLVAKYVDVPVEPRQFVARDLINILTVEDLLAIERAVSEDAHLRLLWIRLRSQGDRPIQTDSESFAQGWSGIVAALGDDRAAQIAAALGIGA